MIFIARQRTKLKTIVKTKKKQKVWCSQENAENEINFSNNKFSIIHTN